MGTIATFPNLILIEPDYVSIKLPTNENLEHFENFQNGLNLSNEDLMNRMDSILRGKTWALSPYKKKYLRVNLGSVTQFN